MEDTRTDWQTQKDTEADRQIDVYIDRQQGDLVSLILFFQNKESMLKNGKQS
jgi:hypothetical protein